MAKWRGMRKGALLAVCILVLLTMASCRIPGDTTTPGSTPTPPTTLTVGQRFGKGVSQQESAVVAKLHGKVVYQNTLAPPVGTPTPSPVTLRSGILDPGTYSIVATQHACSQSCAQPGKKVTSTCAIQVVVKENEPVEAIIHVGLKSCFIEVG
ncbi:MAG: hypothetical protein ABR579_03975 [Actinomycetota bacterium]